MSGPFPDIRFMVSGGVSLTNIKEYVQAGVTGICLGSAYLTSTLAQKGHAGLVSELQQFVSLVDEAQRKKRLDREQQHEPPPSYIGLRRLRSNPPAHGRHYQTRGQRAPFSRDVRRSDL